MTPVASIREVVYKTKSREKTAGSLGFAAKKREKREMLLVSPECLHMFQSLKTKSYFSQPFHNHSRIIKWILYFQTWFRDYDNHEHFQTLKINC